MTAAQQDAKKKIQNFFLEHSQGPFPKELLHLWSESTTRQWTLEAVMGLQARLPKKWGPDYYKSGRYTGEWERSSEAKDMESKVATYKALRKWCLGSLPSLDQETFGAAWTSLRATFQRKKTVDLETKIIRFANAANAADQWRKENWSQPNGVPTKEPTLKDLGGRVFQLEEAFQSATSKSATALNAVQDSNQKLQQLRAQHTELVDKKRIASHGARDARAKLEMLKAQVAEMEKETTMKEQAFVEVERQEAALLDQKERCQHDSEEKALDLEHSQDELRSIEDVLVEARRNSTIADAKSKMEAAAKELNFEEAAKFRDLIRQLENGDSMEVPPSPTPSDCDTIVPSAEEKSDQSSVEDDGEEDGEVAVEEREHNGETYYVDPTNGDIYDIESVETIGKWEGDEATGKPVLN